MIPKTQTALDAHRGRGAGGGDPRRPRAARGAARALHLARRRHADPRLSAVTLAAIAALARRVGLAVARRASIPAPDDGAPAGCGTLRAARARRPGLLGRSSRRAPSAATARADPLDRWSERVIGALAAAPRRRRRSSPSAARRGSPSPPGRGGAARPGSRRSGSSSMPGSGSSSPIAAPWRFAARLALPPPAGAALRRLRRGPASPPARSGRWPAAATTSPPATAFSTPRPGATASAAAARCAAPARWGGGCGPRRNRPSTWRPFMAGRAHATPDPHAPRQVELGRSRPARPRPAAQQARPARAPALIGGWLKREGLSARRRRWSRPPAAPRRPGPAWSPSPGAAPTTYLPELYHAGPETLLDVLRRGAATRTRADARPPAGDRRLRRAGCSPSRRRTPTSTSSRPRRPPSSTSTSPTGRRSAGGPAGSSTSPCRGLE